MGRKNRTTRGGTQRGTKRSNPGKLERLQSKVAAGKTLTDAEWDFVVPRIEKVITTVDAPSSKAAPSTPKYNLPGTDSEEESSAEQVDPREPGSSSTHRLRALDPKQDGEETFDDWINKVQPSGSSSSGSQTAAATTATPAAAATAAAATTNDAPAECGGGSRS